MRQLFSMLAAAVVIAASSFFTSSTLYAQRIASNESNAVSVPESNGPSVTSTGTVAPSTKVYLPDNIVVPKVAEEEVEVSTSSELSRSEPSSSESLRSEPSEPFAPAPTNLRVQAQELPKGLLSMYPMPVSDELTLVAQDPNIRFGYLDCLDALGNPVNLRHEWKDGALHVYPRNIPNGSYTLYVQIGASFYRTQINIER